MSGEQLTVATLNTRGIPVTGSRLADRYAVIGAGFDAGDVDVACFQEVLTYWHLRLLVRRMRSFRQVSYRPAPAARPAVWSRSPGGRCRVRHTGVSAGRPGFAVSPGRPVTRPR